MNHLTTEITPSNIRLQVGKFYRSRGGEIVKIVEYRGQLAADDDWPFFGDDDRVYRADGGWLRRHESALDLIEEIAE